MSSLLEDGIDYNILISVSLLDNQEKYYEGTENESLLKDHARSLKNGLRFLGKLYPFLSVDGNLAARVKLLAADVKHSLISYEDENGVLDIMNLEHSYTDVLGLMRSLVINPGISRESFHMFIKDLHQDNYYQGTENGSILKNHARSLKNGLRFLDKLYSFLVMDGNLATRVKLLAADVKYTLTAYEDENEVLGVMKLEHAYADVLGLMRSLVINPGIRCESFRMFRKDLHSMHNYRRIIDLLIENTFEVLRPGTDDQTVAFVKKVRELRMAITYYKPLYRCVAHPSHLYHHLTHIPLDFILNEAARAIYLLLVGKMDEETVVSSMQRVMSFDKQCRNLNMYVRFLSFSSTEFSSDKKGQFYILDNLIHILAMNLDSLNDANNYLYAELRELRTFVESQRGSERLNHYLGLTASTESICYQAVPIVYSCYMEEVDLEEDMCRKLNDIIISVIGQIKMIKRNHGSQEIKLYDYPRVDCLGFYFMGHLKELQGCEQTSVISRAIEALHTDIHCLVSSPKTSQDTITSKGLWTHVARLAYQAEYVMDLYLIMPDSRCIVTLSNIVEELNEIKEKLLALMGKSLPVEDVPLTTSSHVHGAAPHVNNVFVGFHEEIDAMMKYLLGGENDLQAISVVGMAGAGKTSLAMHLFKESSVVGHFDIKVWCTVSQSYQMKDLLLTILNQINPDESDIKTMDDEELADKLCRSLKRRRYLVVLDDVWDVFIWNYLSWYFPNDKTRSRILITTRDHNVASETMSNIHELQALTEDESWELLQKKLPQKESLRINLVNIAKEVAKSCKGLPLSIVIVGGLMHSVERNEELWNQIAKDATSTILSDPEGKCEEILELSYRHLPNHLKACLLYLGVFPEDCEISVTRLVRLWVAEGLVSGKTSEGSMEDVGRRYVDDLITRSLISPIKEKSEGGVKIFQLHDLLREFCLKKAKEEHFLTMLNDRGIFDLSLFPRRISINHGMDKHLCFISMNSVRTIISFSTSNFIYADIELILESGPMMLLNVLDMHELVNPASYVHRFIHLRYLAIWKIHRSDQFFLQSSFSKLWNLQILILSFSYNHVFEVPDLIWDLVKLRHIHLLPSALFRCVGSRRLEDSSVLLENLKSLSKPRLHYGDSNWLSKLPELQKLSCIMFTSWDYSLQRYQFPELDLCNQLTSLKVENGAERNERERGKLHLPENLRKLSLSGFILVSDDISEIGKSLPNLEVLKLHNCIENWSVNDEDFPTLKVLKVTGRNWQEWDASEDSFSSLEQLWLKSCYSLKGIPPSFGDIPCLRLISIEYCSSSVYESAREIEKIQIDAQNLELKVILKGQDAYETHFYRQSDH